MTFAEKVIQFNQELEYTGPPLPSGIRIMNPYKEEELAMGSSSEFYRKFYSDENKRHLILGINPGRFGGGVTGVPFTDPKRLISECHIPYEGRMMHEPSSVYVYEVIRAYGGPEAFYRDIYINSLCPLGFTIMDNKGREKNYNYYDSKELSAIVTPFIIDNIKKQIALGCYTDTCFCFGTGQNEKFLKKVNNEHGFFKEIVALEHPRFIMQYKAKSQQAYIDKYLKAFSGF
ncbi:uracil-DNA glycosylase family protein [Mucilaginibacter sp.]|uniref:uracil-DNA glycosylase family protein n=1 Tax=Mucilaginibacter sp. TaxID=1882438 RepID=UPI003265509F